LINALRGHLSEHGVVAAQGPANVKVLEEAVEDQGTSLPLLVVELARVFLDQIEGLWIRISGLEKVTVHEAACGETTRRLQTMPGVSFGNAMLSGTGADAANAGARRSDEAAARHADSASAGASSAARSRRARVASPSDHASTTDPPYRSETPGASYGPPRRLSRTLPPRADRPYGRTD